MEKYVEVLDSLMQGRKEKKKTMERYSSGHKNDPGGGKYYGYDACDQYDTLRAGK